jgi:choline dehydrogenase-like flavoprotein
MILDARRLPRDTIIDADVCIVGAGAAGITLAREFVGQPFKVCLIESGGLEFDDETQSLYEGDLVGLPLDAPEDSRLRYFGGTTNHWAGACRPLDADDFAFRPWIPYSGWPIAKVDLDPYYPPANEIVQIDEVDWSPEFWAEQMPEFYRLPFMGRRLLPAIWQKSPPTRFGQTYRDELARADNVETSLFANVVDIETNDATGAVTRLGVACLEGNRFWVKARIYVLATGGIENARILLLSNKVRPAGIGNSFDTVGRFFMNHPQLDAAWLALSTPSDLTATPFSALTKTVVRLTLTPGTAEREGTAKFAAHLRPSDIDGVYTLGKGYGALQR